mgnify:CR=1 FL=1
MNNLISLPRFFILSISSKFGRYLSGAKLYGSELVLFDGTLWVNDEMSTSKVGEKTGQRMGHMNNSGPDGTIASFEDIEVNRKIFIHINTTNPILLPDSPERKEVEDSGWEVSFDGMEIIL